MKEIHEAKIETLYLCEVCGRKHRIKDFAIICEKGHTCKHETFYYDWNHIEGNDETYISKYCKECEHFIEEVKIEDLEKDQEKMKALFEMIKSL